MLLTIVRAITYILAIKLAADSSATFTLSAVSWLNFPFFSS